jgi:hypothetical protein
MPSAKDRAVATRVCDPAQIYEAVRFRGKGEAMQRAAARRLGRKGEDPTQTYMGTPTKLRWIVKLLLVGAAFRGAFLRE